MAKSERDIWFPAKIFGWGWGLPVTWQGWSVLMAYLALSVVGTVKMRGNIGFSGILVYLFSITVLLIAICWYKGEKPRWRWGE